MYIYIHICEDVKANWICWTVNGIQTKKKITAYLESNIMLQLQALLFTAIIFYIVNI